MIVYSILPFEVPVGPLLANAIRCTKLNRYA